VPELVMKTVANDYFAALERAEQRLEIVPVQEKEDEVVKVQESQELFKLMGQLETPELFYEER